MPEIVGQLTWQSARDRYARQIFRYAIATGKAEVDPVPNLRGVLKAKPKGHHAVITVDELPAFLATFQNIEGCMYTPARIMFTCFRRYLW